MLFRSQEHEPPRWLVLLIGGIAVGAAGVVLVQERYLPPRRLSAAEADLLAQLDAGTPATAFNSATIRALEADRVLEFNWDPS